MEHLSEINIKGMVCDRCIATIGSLLIDNGYVLSQISLGKVVFHTPIAAPEKQKIADLLASLGFELISDKSEKLLAEIKLLIEEWRLAAHEGQHRERLSDFLAERLNKGYDSIGEFFSKYEGQTIEKYFIGRRIESVREMLAYTDLSLSEIAFSAGFSSVHHLSAQFKKATGMNPSKFREVKNARLGVLQENYGAGNLKHAAGIV